LAPHRVPPGSPGQFYMYIFQQLEDRSNTAQNDPENLLYSFHAMENRISQKKFSLLEKFPKGFNRAGFSIVIAAKREKQVKNVIFAVFRLV
jgi:hypothetical protein